MSEDFGISEHLGRDTAKPRKVLDHFVVTKRGNHVKIAWRHVGRWTTRREECQDFAP